MTADYAYAVGDEIFHSEPWVFSILGCKLKTHCYHCLEGATNNQDIRRCTGCLLAGYCSEKCQKNDWKLRHRDECKILKCAASSTSVETPAALSEDDLNRLMVLLKIIGKLKRGEFGDAPRACQPSGNRTFHDLMSHESELLRLHPALLNSYRLLKPCLDRADSDQKICPDYLSFLRLWGKFLINNFAVYDLRHPTVLAVGRGLYLQPSILDHSCQPNALQISVGKTVRIVVIRPIQRRTDVRIAYMSPFDLTETRRAYLEKGYFFTCRCVACIDTQLIADRNAMLCSNQNCLIPITLNESAEERCRTCNADNREQYQNAKNAVNRLTAAILDSHTRKDTRTCQKLRTAIKEATLCLFPTNFTLGVAHKELVSVLGDSDSDLDESMESLLKVIVSRWEHIQDYCYQPCFLVLKWLVEKNRDSEAMALAARVSDFIRIMASEKSRMYESWCHFVSEL